MKREIAHWTASSSKDFQFRVASDFVAQLESYMNDHGWNQAQLAKELQVTEGRVSQILNNPGNLSIGLMVKCVRALGMKMGIVVYNDDDTQNIQGPINPEVFRICWEKCGKPADFWMIEEQEGKYSATTTYIMNRLDPQFGQNTYLFKYMWTSFQKHLLNYVYDRQKDAVTTDEWIGIGQLTAFHVPRASSGQDEDALAKET